MVDLMQVLLITFLIEILVIFARFSLKIRLGDIIIKTMKHFDMKKYYHVHHCFTGLAIILFAYFYESSFLINLGLGFIFSDMIHHFIVLYLIVGNPEFHVVYKNLKFFKKEEAFEKRKFKKFLRNFVRHG
jgi:hypothetical protein